MDHRPCRQTQAFNRRTSQLALWICALIAWSAILATSRSGEGLAIAQSGRPLALTNEEFWDLSQTLSESGEALATSYLTENLVSNEAGFQKVLPALAERHPKGDVYLGVGPEQNFTYIAALDPAVAFIVDIRRENRDVLLMYKALFELADDRVSFLSLLFSRPIPPGLERNATVSGLFAAFSNVEPSEALCEATLLKIKRQLLDNRKFALSNEEVLGVTAVFREYYKFGPSITYNSNISVARGFDVTVVSQYDPTLPSYADLMTAADSTGQASSYLSSEIRYQTVRTLQARNLIIPVVGNFGGPTSIRAIGAWVRQHGLRVALFYVSNVESYLAREHIWSRFCSNVATLPLAPNADFIRWRYLQPQPETQPSVPGSRVAVSARVVVEPGADWKKFRADVQFSEGPWELMTLEEANRLLPAGPPNVNYLSDVRSATANCGTNPPR